MSYDAGKFLAQNDEFAEGLTAEDLDVIEMYAEHHCGGLYVLGRDLDGGRYVKLHDSWGPDECVVVHTYDPAIYPDETETVEMFTSLHEAIAAFLKK